MLSRVENYSLYANHFFQCLADKLQMATNIELHISSVLDQESQTLTSSDKFKKKIHTCIFYKFYHY